MINTTSIADELIYVNETCGYAQLIIPDTIEATSSPTTTQPSSSHNTFSTAILSILPSISQTYASIISNPTSVHVTEAPSFTNGYESAIDDTTEEISNENMIYWIITAILIDIDNDQVTLGDESI